jgi:flavin-dependent dehydrogenase
VRLERRSAIIVGSGPAGAATALRLAQVAPRLAADAVMLEKARHPRDKTCAGGLIPKAVRLLADLGVPLDVPYAMVDEAMVGVPGRRLRVPGRDLCRVIRRRELDARLADAARGRGVALHEGEHAVRVVRDGDGVRVETPRRAFWAPVVVGADGSGSLVRRSLVPDGRAPVARAVMCDVPVERTRWDGAGARRYEFDFGACARGLRGYRWTFPCLIDGRPHANVGVYALPPADGAQLQAELAAELARVGASMPPRWKAFPIRTYVRGVAVAAPHALLAGDAAGCDPLMGEGISFALEYGALAGDAIVRAHARGDFRLADYARAVHRGPLGRKLRRLAFAVRVFYGRVSPLAFRIAGASARAQTIGLAWYNGTL